MSPTSSQVHLALQLLEQITRSPRENLVPTHTRLASSAADTLQRALGDSEWTGETSTTEPFGHEIKSDRAEIDQLSQSLRDAGDVIGILQPFVEEMASSENPEIREKARDVLVQTAKKLDPDGSIAAALRAEQEQVSDLNQA